MISALFLSHVSRLAAQAHLNLFRISDGAEQYLVEWGKFELRYNNQIKTFDSLLAAFKKYITIPYEASLYDVSNGEALIERKRLLNLS